MTPKEYAFNEFGSQVINLSMKDDPKGIVTGWICPKCKEEVIRIKNL